MCQLGAGSPTCYTERRKERETERDRGSLNEKKKRNAKSELSINEQIRKERNKNVPRAQV